MPKYVVNPVTEQLTVPKELCPLKISKAILNLKSDSKLTNYLSNNIFEHIKNNFNIEKYISKTNSILSKYLY